VLLVASTLMLVFTYDCRIRPPEEVRSQMEVQWRLSAENLVLTTAGIEKVIQLPSVCGVLRTSAGFIVWPSNPIEVLLPIEAFGGSEQIEQFSDAVRSQVHNYVEAS